MWLENQVHGTAQHIVEFVRAHEMWAAPIVGALAFGESLAFISLVLPAWAVVVAVGAMIAQGGINFWPVWVAGAVGAALGDWLSYWIGTKLGPAVADIWPLSRHPDLLPRSEPFVTKWGPLAIFIGRFSGPLRAVVPSCGRHLRNAILALPNRQFRFLLSMGSDAAHAGGCCDKGFQIHLAMSLRDVGWAYIAGRRLAQPGRPSSPPSARAFRSCQTLDAVAHSDAHLS